MSVEADLVEFLANAVIILAFSTVYLGLVVGVLLMVVAADWLRAWRRWRRRR